MTDPILTLGPSAPRRLFALVVLYLLAALLIILAGQAPNPTPWARAVLFVSGVVALIGAEALRRATRIAIHLTETELVTSAGEVLCRLDDVVAVDRGVFAFKPSNGFVLKLVAPAPRAWAPGIWWRIGRRVGIGGITHAAPAKAMAEAIAAHVALRSAP